MSVNPFCVASVLFGARRNSWCVISPHFWSPVWTWVLLLQQKDKPGSPRRHNRFGRTCPRPKIDFQIQYKCIFFSKQEKKSFPWGKSKNLFVISFFASLRTPFHCGSRRTVLSWKPFWRWQEPSLQSPRRAPQIQIVKALRKTTSISWNRKLWNAENISTSLRHARNCLLKIMIDLFSHWNILHPVILRKQLQQINVLTSWENACYSNPLTYALLLCCRDILIPYASSENDWWSELFSRNLVRLSTLECDVLVVFFEKQATTN